MKRPTRKCKPGRMDRSELHSPGVDTDDRFAFAREALLARPGEFDLRNSLRAAREGMRDVVAERMRQFDTARPATRVTTSRSCSRRWRRATRTNTKPVTR
jgi:hypothetical protein